jgi:hypothetical protein
MSRNLVMKRILELEENDPLIRKIKNTIEGVGTEAGEEPLLPFKAIAKAVGYDPSWLRRLGVHETCALRLAGGKRYRKSKVVAFLQSPECQTRVEKIRKNRASQNSRTTGVRS